GRLRVLADLELSVLGVPERAEVHERAGIAAPVVLGVHREGEDRACDLLGDAQVEHPLVGLERVAGAVLDLRTRLVAYLFRRRLERVRRRRSPLRGHETGTRALPP